jgi:hypothetical protein
MVGLIIAAIISVILGILLTNGIDYMHRNHPDYKGEDFLGWDEDKNHTEGEF